MTGRTFGTLSAFGVYRRQYAPAVAPEPDKLAPLGCKIGTVNMPDWHPRSANLAPSYV